MRTRGHAVADRRGGRLGALADDLDDLGGDDAPAVEVQDDLAAEMPLPQARDVLADLPLVHLHFPSDEPRAPVLPQIVLYERNCRRLAINLA